jgi:hypothetical protein
MCGIFKAGFRLVSDDSCGDVACGHPRFCDQQIASQDEAQQLSETVLYIEWRQWVDKRSEFAL